MPSAHASSGVVVRERLSGRLYRTASVSGTKATFPRDAILSQRLKSSLTLIDSLKPPHSFEALAAYDNGWSEDETLPGEVLESRILRNTKG